jgi:hypothetical protein
MASNRYLHSLVIGKSNFHFWMIRRSAENAIFCYLNITQGRNHGENLGLTSAMVGRSAPPSWDMVKVSENLGATVVAPVAPTDTSLSLNHVIQK